MSGQAGLEKATSLQQAEIWSAVGLHGKGVGGGGEARFVDCHSHNTHLGIASESEAAFGVGAWDGMGADFKGIGKIAGVGMGDSKT